MEEKEDRPPEDTPDPELQSTDTRGIYNLDVADPDLISQFTEGKDINDDED